MHLKSWICLFLAVACGFVLGKYTSISDSVAVQSIEPIRYEFRSNDELNKLFEDKLDEQSMQYLESHYQDFPTEFHPYTKKIEFGPMLLAGNDDFTNYCLALNKNGKLQLIASCHVDGKETFLHYYAPDVNLIHCPAEFGAANAVCSIIVDSIESTQSVFYTRKGHTYADSDDDGVWDAMFTEEKNGEVKIYRRDGFSWKDTTDM